MSLRIGVDLGGTKIEAVALDSDGRALARRRVPTPQGDYEATLDAVALVVAEIEHEGGARGTVGVGTPGAVSPASGLLRNSNSVCLNGMPLREDLAERLGREVRIANDADCFALSEAVDGAGAGARTVFGVILGTGVGGGIVVDGRLLSGPNAIAGEWGHNPLPWPLDEERPGPECYCGKRGCIETFLSGPGLANDLKKSAGLELHAHEIAARAGQGEAACAAALERYHGRLARALASVINLIDPEVIVLGGGVSGMASLYERVPPLLARWVFSDVVRTRLARNVHGDSGGVRGAAWLWGR